MNPQDPAELPGDCKELHHAHTTPLPPPAANKGENNKIVPVLSHKVLGLLLMQCDLTDTPGGGMDRETLTLCRLGP